MVTSWWYIYVCPQLIIPSSNSFGDLIGFSPGVITFDSSNDIINNQYSILNNFAPNVEVQNNVIITCNLINNELGRPTNILHCFAPINSNFGSSIQGVHEIFYSKIKSGTYKNLELNIYDQDYKLLEINDPNMVINISIIKNND